MLPLLFFFVGHALAVRHRSVGDECDQESDKLEGLLAKWCKRIVSDVDCEGDASGTMKRGSYYPWQVYLGNKDIETKTPVLSAGFSDASRKDLQHFVTKMKGALSTDSDWFGLAKEANHLASCPKKRWYYWRAAYIKNALAMRKTKPKKILIALHANTTLLWDSVFFLEELRRLGHEIFHGQNPWGDESNWVPWNPHFEIYDIPVLGAPCSVAPALMEQLSMWARRNVSMTCRSCSKGWENCAAAVDVPMPTKPYCVSGDCRNGYGQQRLPGGSTYTGNFKHGAFDGKGTLDGPVAVRSDVWVKARGEYKDGKQSGNWTLVFDTGDRLEMTYQNGNINGWSVYTWANGDQQRTRYEAGQQVEQEERKPAK